MAGRLDQTRPFLPVNIALLTVSDTRTAADDRSGNTLAELAETAGHRIVVRQIVRDDLDAIAGQLRRWIADPNIDVVIATGGTGVTGRDVTPEAFHSVYEKEIAGFGELFRWLSYEKIGTSTIQSRATAGVAGGTYLFVLPGSPSACRDAWEGILVHQPDNRFRPCNFVELMPRPDGRRDRDRREVGKLRQCEMCRAPGYRRRPAPPVRAGMRRRRGACARRDCPCPARQSGSRAARAAADVEPNPA